QAPGQGALRLCGAFGPAGGLGRQPGVGGQFKLKTFESYPLGATPLSLFLAKQIRLDRGVQVTRVTRLADGFSLPARDGKKEAEGQITLTFSDAPMQLVGWTITDPQGQGTRVRLTRLEKVTSLDDSLFVLKDPRNLRPGRS